MSNSAYKYTDKQLLAIATAILVGVIAVITISWRYIDPILEHKLKSSQAPTTTSTSKMTNFGIHHLYQLPDGRKISVGYHNTNTYVSIPGDAQYVSHVAVWSEECLGVMAPSRGTLHLRVYPLNTTVFNEANSTVLKFNFPMKNAKKWDEPILVYTDDLRKWLEDISANPTDN